MADVWIQWASDIQALEELLQHTNHLGKATADAAAYNKRCGDLLKDKYGAKHVAKKPDDWQAPLAKDHIWQRKKYR